MDHDEIQRLDELHRLKLPAGYGFCITLMKDGKPLPATEMDGDLHLLLRNKAEWITFDLHKSYRLLLAMAGESLFARRRDAIDDAPEEHAALETDLGEARAVTDALRSEWEKVKSR